MILVKLTGGMGNQMFQYAAARRLASVHNTGVKLDLTFLNSDQPGVIKRNYELCHLNISAEIASQHELAAFSKKRSGLLESVWSTFLRKFKIAASLPCVYREPHFHFDLGLLTAPDNTYLDGYWQSEKYFVDITQILHQEFTFNFKADVANEQLAEQIKGENSVSVHIRRGDYVSNPIAKQVLGICPVEYYYKAVALITASIEKPHFYIFSDDPTWAMENIKLNFPTTFVRQNINDKSFEDMRLMSLCKHNIIANSSFSWWGAWLNKNTAKIVSAPAKWFNDPSYNTSDLLPDAWVKI